MPPSESVFLSFGEILGSLRTYLICRFHFVSLLLSPASHWQSNPLAKYFVIMLSHFFSAFLEQSPTPSPTRLCSFPYADKGIAQSDPTGWESRTLILVHQNLQSHLFLDCLYLSYPLSRSWHCPCLIPGQSFQQAVINL